MARIGICCLLLGALAGGAAGDGILIPEPPFQPLAIQYHRVQVEIDDQAARTRIDQVFLNRQERDLEATYIFPLPPEASFSAFSMHVDGEPLEAEILDADEARRIYEEIVRQRIDPALLEYVGQGAYRARVFPVPANGPKRIELAYDELLRRDGGLVRYVYPLNTEKFSAEPLEDVSVQVRIRSTQPLGPIYSPSHEIEVDRISDTEARVIYADEGVTPRQDFVLYYGVATDAVGLELLSFADGEDDGYYLLLAAPTAEPSTDQVLPKRMVFVFDRSGSMRDGKLEQARAALRFAIGQLRPEDRFNIIDYGTTVSQFADSALVADEANKAAALEYIDAIEASGGTHIHAALLAGLASFRDDSAVETLVFLTDGKPTIGKTASTDILAAVASANSTGARIFAFGVGHEVNTLLLDRLALDNGGTAAYVEPGEDIQARIEAFYTKVSQPVLRGLELAFDGVRSDDRYPAALPDLFRGGQVSQLGRVRGGVPVEVGVSLTGTVLEEVQRFERRFRIDVGGLEALPRLWATRKVGFLLEQIRLNGEDDELVDEIVALSRRYGIITPYTSFLIVEDEAPAPVVELDGGSLRAASGADAVEASESLRSYAEAQTSSRVQAPRVRYVGDKTFYERESYWRDSQFDPEHPTAELAFGTERYFDLVRQRPELGRFLALGRRVELRLGTQQWRIVAATTLIEERAGAGEGAYLKRVYPNPFNSRVTLEYRSAGRGRLGIFNLSGQRVRVLEGQPQGDQGWYRAVWDGRDAGGSSVGSGLYLIHLEGSPAGDTQKLLLLK